jgi:hypothetical protein
LIIYFNGNNKAHMEALKDCKVKNVVLSFKYSYANITKFRDKFDKIFVVSGTNTEPERYYELLKKHRASMWALLFPLKYIIKT